MRIQVALYNTGSRLCHQHCYRLINMANGQRVGQLHVSPHIHLIGPQRIQYNVSGNNGYIGSCGTAWAGLAQFIDMAARATGEQIDLELGRGVDQRRLAWVRPYNNRPLPAQMWANRDMEQQGVWRGRAGGQGQ